MPLRFETQERIIALRLTDGRPVSTDDLIDALYGDDPEGGALSARSVVAVKMSILRAKFEAECGSTLIPRAQSKMYQVPPASLALFKELVWQEVSDFASNCNSRGRYRWGVKSGAKDAVRVGS